MHLNAMRAMLILVAALQFIRVFERRTASTYKEKTNYRRPGSISFVCEQMMCGALTY